MPARKKTNKKGKGRICFCKNWIASGQIVIQFDKLKKTLFLKIKGNKVVQQIVKKTEKPIKSVYQKIERFFVRIAPRPAKAFVNRHFPLLLAIIFLMPSFILLYIFISSRLNQNPSLALAWTGQIRITKQSTGLSTAGNWYRPMAYSGDGANGNADYFNPIHPRAAATDTGNLAAGYDALPTTAANNYDSAGAEFVPWRPASNGTLSGVIFSLAVTETATLNNYNIVVELLRFPSAHYTGTPPSGSWDAGTYVSCSALNTCTYPIDTVIERRQIMRWDQTISGATAAPGTYGHHYIDFRFDDTFVASTSEHYGFRIYYNNLTTAASWPRGTSTKPNTNAINFGLGITATESGSTITIPLANTNNMVSANSAPSVGAASSARTQNEHWVATYSASTNNWSFTGSVSGLQTNKLTTVTNASSGASFINDGVPVATLSATPSSTRLCVDNITNFARNQYIDVWDSDTASAQYTISSVEASNINCPSSGPAINTTAAPSTSFTVAKNATVAQSKWKLRLVQGAYQSLQQDTDATAVICVSDNSKFATGGTVSIWDDDSALLSTRTISSFLGSCVTGQPITLNSSPGATTYTVAKNAKIAEVSTNIFSSGTPNDGDIFRFTTLNMGQSPTKTGTAANLLIYYSRVLTPATTAVATAVYPYLINLRHPFYVAYGDDGTETPAPVDGDFVIVGGGADSPDPYHSPTLTGDLSFANISPHTLTIDKNFDMPLIYTGRVGGGINNGALTAATTTGGDSGFVSMLLTTRAVLTAPASANQHYRLVLPGRLVLGSGATVQIGTSGSPYPQTSTVDIYEDSSGPTVSTTLDATLSPAATTATLTSVSGFYIGDVVQIKDDDTSPIVVLIASINTSTKVITFAAAVTQQPWVAAVPTNFTYTAAKNATVTRGPNTERPTGNATRSFIYGARAGAARENITTYGTDSYRIPQANLAVDIDGNVDTGYLTTNQLVAGSTWLDVSTSSGSLAGNWSALDPIAVAQGTNLAVNDNDSSIRMGASSISNAFPGWIGGTGLGGNADAAYNPEITEIGTIPLTNIYNVDYNGGTGDTFSTNYATSSAWTIFGDGAGNQAEDAVYFGDQGNTPIYALEFNIGTAISADATRVWEYWNGSTWAAFTPNMAWSYQARGTSNNGVSEYCMPVSAEPTYPTAILQVTDTSSLFFTGQFVKIKADNTPTIIRRISAVTSGVNSNVTFTETIHSGYTLAKNAKVCIPNGGRWMQMDASSLFTQTGRTLISWNTWDIPTPAKKTVNGFSAYWVRNRISVFNSWTTSPTNQATPVGMQGVEDSNSYPFTIFNGVNEAKINHFSKGASFDPNETWVLRYSDSATATAALKTTRWYESQITSYGTAHRYASPSAEVTSAYEKNSQEADWVSYNGDFSWTDYSITTKIYMNQPIDTTSRYIGIALRQDADGYGYQVRVLKSNTTANLRWYTTAAGAETGIGTATNITFLNNTWYCLKAEVFGSALNAKIWQPVSASADCFGDANEPSTWTESETNTTYTVGRFGLVADVMLAGFDDTVVKQLDNTVLFRDPFDSKDCWNVIGSIHGSQGCASPSVPFNSIYLNFTVKHKGGVQCGETGITACASPPANTPEQGDEIYVSPLMRGSDIGLDETTGINTSNTLTKYENWDFVYASSSGNWIATGSAYGAAGAATPGSTYTSPGGEISLKIKSGTPFGPKFGARAAYFQNSVERGVGNFQGLNNQHSAILIQPQWTVTGSNTLYNIEGINGVASQKGTIDFWFKPNFTGSPSYTQYLLDYANNNNTDRILVRLMPNGVIEAIVGPNFGSPATTGKLTKNFSAVAGQWYHFRLAWEDSDSGQLNMKRAWLDGAVFTSVSQGTACGARTGHAGMIRLGNTWLYNSGFDGAIDEFAIFDDAVDTSSSDNWGAFSVPMGPWTNGQTAGTSTNTGNIIFLAHFDEELNMQKGFMWADYFTAHPAIAFTNGVDTIANDRIRVITKPATSKIWVDNTGSQYTPAARIKSTPAYRSAAETGWGTGFQFHHRAASSNASTPISSPVMNLRRQIRIWSDEFVYPDNTYYPPNQGNGILLYYPKDIDINHLEMSQLYQGLYFLGNPFTGSSTFSTQYVRKSAFNNTWTNTIWVASKTLGSQVFDTNNIASNAYYYRAFYESASANITLAYNIMTGYTAYQLVWLNGGRNYTISNNKLLNSYYPLYLYADTTGGSPVAKVTLSNNEFWRYRRGMHIYGNVYIIMSGNSFDGGISSEATNGYYGTAIYIQPSSSNMEFTDTNSYFGRSIWNEVDINMPPDTTSWLAGSLLSYKSENVSFNSPFHYIGLSYQDKFGGEYVATGIPGVDVRMAKDKDITDFSNYGTMKATGAGLNDTTVRTAGGYGWRLESTSKTDSLEYTAKVVGVSGKPLAVTGYMRINSTYGTSNAPAVALSGLGMTGANLTWTADVTKTNSWQQFVVSGTPTDSALATLTFTVKSTPVIADSGTANNVDDNQGICLPTFIEDTTKTWTWNQWAGYKMRDDQGFVFDIIGNTATRLLLKGSRIPFANTLPTQPYGNTYEIFSPPYVYLDDMSVLSGTVDTGTLDYFSQGQPVSPWLATGLTAEGVWNAQFSSFADSSGTFGQLLGDSLVARYADVSGGTPTTTVFNTNLTTATDDFYNNGVIIFTEGENKAVVRRISDYGGASKTITVEPALPFAPTDGDRFAVLAATAASTGTGGATAAEIWSYAFRRLTDENLASTGGKLATQADIQGLNNITAASVWAVADKTITGVTTAGAQNIWDTACAILSTSGSIGKKVCDNLDVLVSSRSTLTAADVWTNATRTITSLENTALTAIWERDSRTLTYYGNNITAQDVWNVLVSNLTLVDSIGKLLVTNVDDQISEKSSQSSLDTHSQAVATTSALVDTSVSSRASQSSLDSHESSEASFRTTTTDTLGTMTANIAIIKTDLSDIETKIDTIITELATIETKIDAIGTSTDTYNKVVEVSNSLKTVTDRIGKVSVDSFTQLFEVKKTDIDYLKNKTLELKAVSDIDRQLLEKTVNQPVVKVMMEWGSVIIKFIIVNPSDSTTQKIPFKAFLPKEVKQEYIIDLGGLNLNYDTSTEQYYVTADITLKAGEAVTRSVEIKDIWVISEDEINSLRKQSEELSNGLKNTSYYAQSLTLKTDVNTRLDKVARKQKENNATPQDHILAYRDNSEDIKAVNEDLKGLKDLVLNSGVGTNFLASVGGIQTFATWGIVLVLIFGMGALGSFYYTLWKKKVVAVPQGKKGKKEQTIELPTPMPYELPLFKFDWLKRIFIGLGYFIKHSFGLGRFFYKKTVDNVPKTAWMILIVMLPLGILAYGFVYSQNTIKQFSLKPQVVPVTPKPLSLEERRTKAAIAERIKKVREEKEKNTAQNLVNNTVSVGGELKTSLSQKASVITIGLKDRTNAVNVREKAETKAPIIAKIKGDKNYLYISEQGDWYQIEIEVGKRGWVNKEFVEKIETAKIAQKESRPAVLGSNAQYQQMLVIKQTPTDWLNVREKPSMSAKIITKIYPGESYPFSESQNGWFKILLKDLKEGWVSGGYVRIEKQLNTDKKNFVEIVPPAGSGINIRENPDQTAKVIKTVYIKNKYELLVEEKDWVQIELLDGTSGWISREFVNKQ